jgi:hypothetical protein
LVTGGEDGCSRIPQGATENLERARELHGEKESQYTGDSHECLFYIHGKTSKAERYTLRKTNRPVIME